MARRVLRAVSIGCALAASAPAFAQSSLYLPRISMLWEDVSDDGSDADTNDLGVRVNARCDFDAGGDLIGEVIHLTAYAAGASLPNGLTMQLRGPVSAVTWQRGGDQPVTLTPDGFDRVRIADDAKAELFAGGSGFVNTGGGPVIEGIPGILRVDYAAPVPVGGPAECTPPDLLLSRPGVLVGANAGPGVITTYGSNNQPLVAIVGGDFAVPTERTPIQSAYERFLAYVTEEIGGGCTANCDWDSDPTDGAVVALPDLASTAPLLRQIAGSDGNAAANLPLIDDFEAEGIDLAKWLDPEWERTAVGGATWLQVYNTCTSSPCGPSETVDQLIAIPPATPALDFSATLTPLYVGLNGPQARVRTELTLLFQPPGYTNNTDIVYARLEILKENAAPGKGLYARAHVGHCTDPVACATDEPYTLLAGSEVWDMPMEEPVVARVRYDAPSEEFVVTMDDGDALHTWRFDMNTALPSNFAFDPSQFLRARVRTRASGVTGVGHVARSVVGIDDVTFADVPFDAFTADRLAFSRWSSGDRERVVDQGALAVGMRQANSHDNIFVRLADPSRTTLGMKARLTEYQATGGGFGRQRVGGRFYNDGSVGDGLGLRNGDIGADVAVTGNRVGFVLYRCTTSDCRTSTTLTIDPSSGQPGYVTIAPSTTGQTHDLFIGYEDGWFVFQADDGAPVLYKGPAVAGPAGVPDRFVGPRCNVGPGGTCSVFGEIEEVRGGTLALFE